VIFAAAQEIAPVNVKVGDAIVSAERLQPYKNLWQMSITKPDGTVADAGDWSDQLEAVTMDGKSCLKRTQVARFKKKDGSVAVTNTTVNVFEKKTFAPVLRTFESHGGPNGDSQVKIKFTPHSMTIDSVNGGKSETKEVPLKSQAFDFNGGLYAVLWSGFPLKPGFSATFPSFGENDPAAITDVTFKVTGSEIADAGPKGKLETLVVETPNDESPMKFWLSKEAPYVIRLEFKQSNGTLWTYKMI
jgi:hypothetical protein